MPLVELAERHVEIFAFLLANVAVNLGSTGGTLPPVLAPSGTLALRESELPPSFIDARGLARPSCEVPSRV